METRINRARRILFSYQPLFKFLLFLPPVLILLPRYFSAHRRLQNDKFSTLKKDLRCLKGTFCAALSFRLLFASLVLYLSLTPQPLSFFSLPLPLCHFLSLFLSFLTYLLSFLAWSLHLSFSLSPSSVALTATLLPPLLCKFTMLSLVISGCALRSRLWAHFRYRGDLSS